MADLVLVRHWYDHWPTSAADNVHRHQPTTGHPPIPTSPQTLDRLRSRVHDRATQPGHPLHWHHRSGNAWAAVTDLHQAGEHDLAVDLARLLHWCDQWPWDPGHAGVRVWSLTPPDQHDNTTNTTNSNDEGT